MFIDSASISLKAGDGGRGCVAFRREKYVPRGGPSGGDGGNGGGIYLESSSHVNTLLQFRYKKRFVASSGRHGQGSNRHGRRGVDLVLKVPVGSIVHNKDTSTVLHDFVSRDERILAALGGRGGRGNARFTTPTLQAPHFAEDGSAGEEVHLQLELKLLADVGLLGLPNAGKSTLISVISAAKPKIADYPFTTLTPHLGVVEIDYTRQFVVVDIPGLVEGAHSGKGLGGRFLRHVERTRLLAHLVDVSDTGAPDPVERLEVINRELRLYNPLLSGKPQIVVASKVDATRDLENQQRLQDFCTRKGKDFVAISAVTGKGVPELKNLLVRRLLKNEFGPEESSGRQVSKNGVSNGEGILT